MSTIKAVAFYRDGGDGGGSTRVYNSLEELKAEEFKVDTWNTAEKQEKRFQAVIAEDDPYENGEISNVIIEIKQSADGTFSLAKPLHLHWGQ